RWINWKSVSISSVDEYPENPSVNGSMLRSTWTLLSDRNASSTTASYVATPPSALNVGAAPAAGTSMSAKVAEPPGLRPSNAISPSAIGVRFSDTRTPLSNSTSTGATSSSSAASSSSVTEAASTGSGGSISEPSIASSSSGGSTSRSRIVAARSTNTDSSGTSAAS